MEFADCVFSQSASKRRWRNANETWRRLGLRQRRHHERRSSCRNSMLQRWNELQPRWWSKLHS